MVVTKRLKRFEHTAPYIKPMLNHRLYWITKHRWSDAMVEEFMYGVLRWCSRKFGTKPGGTPTIDWTWNHRDWETEGTFAEYHNGDNTIYIRIQGHRNIYNLANTIIHEYVHYLQPNGWYWRHLTKWGYDQNPYELEAYHLGDSWAGACVAAVIPCMRGMRANRAPREGGIVEVAMARKRGRSRGKKTPRKG